jgi:glycosyltransferase involved in cell wall biosynthesis
MINKDNRIKTLNHFNNLGVYNSRVDAVLLSRGKYILLMDPDDMLLNPNLFKELYKYNLNFNLDIIEFTVLCYYENISNLRIKESMYHYHNLDGIIYQPKLSDIYYYDSITKNYNHLLYLKKFYCYIKEFKKDRNFLFYELKVINILLIKLKNITRIYNQDINNFYKEILNDQNSSKAFKEYVNNFAIF